MTLEEIYYVGQTIAAIAIIGSLVALIAQNHAAHKLVRDAAIRSQVEGLQNIPRALFETPGMADVWVRGIENIDQLSNEDRVKFMAFVTYTFRIWEGLHAQFRHSQLDKEVWRGHTQMLRGVQVLAGVKNVWGLRRHAFSQEFQIFYESNLAQAASQDLYELKEPATTPSPYA